MALALLERKKCSPGFNEKKPRNIRGSLDHIDFKPGPV